jgi:dihydropteroate synthase
MIEQVLTLLISGQSLLDQVSQMSDADSQIKHLHLLLSLLTNKYDIEISIDTRSSKVAKHFLIKYFIY